MKKVFLIVCFFASGLHLDAGAQVANVTVSEMTKVFQAISDWFIKTPAYSVVVTHASFETHSSKIPVETARGYFKKDKFNYHSYLMGIHTIQNKEYKIVVDTAESMILVANPDQLTWSAYSMDDYQLLLRESKTIKMSIVGKDKIYRIELTNNPAISAYEFTISSTGLLREVVWYYSKEVQKDENDPASKVRPRVSITFSGYNEKPVYDFDETFAEERYFTVRGKKLLPTAAFASFKLIDQRYRN